MADDNFEGNVYDSKESETELHKCPACGANLTFSASEQQLVCEHCDNKVKFETSKNVVERDFSDADNAKSWNETRVYRCNNCGAKEVLQSKEIALICPFCGSTNILKSEELSGIKPDSLVPFAIDAKDAAQHYNRWIKGKLFAPSKLRKGFLAEQVKGVYCPTWTFDSYTSTQYSGKLGQTRTRTVGSGKNRHTETYIHWFRVNGVHDRFFDDIMIKASSRFLQKDLDAMQPFPQKGYFVYSDKFLAGFMADHYDKDIRTAFPEAERIMTATIKREIMKKHGADHWGADMYMKLSHLKKSFKYMLLPIYICNFEYGAKVYNFFINGATGKTTGKYPKSKVKMLLFGIVVAGIIAAIAFLAFKFGQ
jgi:DNA-directed RNA polymerase subunit RPC12/RpoP